MKRGSSFTDDRITTDSVGVGCKVEQTSGDYLRPNCGNSRTISQ